MTSTTRPLREDMPVPGALVLVADDDAERREEIRLIVSDGGFGVLAVGAGADAIEALERAIDGRARMPDALVVDVCMPDYAGMGLLAAMRAIALDMPTIVITGASDDRVARMAGDLGAFCVLRRPLDAERLRRAARAAVLDRH